MESDQAQARRGADDQGTAAVSHALLVKDLKPICSKWEEFGLNLGIPFDQLQKIRNNVAGRGALTDFCFSRVIDAWLTGKRENVTKEFLVEAIKGVGGFGVLVSKVEAMTFKKKPKAGPFLQLLSSMKPKYSELGVQLGLDLAKIKQFEAHAGDVGNCLNQAVYYWIHNMQEEKDDDDDDDDEESNRDTLYDALVAVGNKGLADTLKEKYKDMEFPGEDKAPSIG